MSSGNKRFGELVGSLRRGRGLSLADLASATYVSRGWVNNVEAGRRWPARSWVEQVERECGAIGELVPAWDRIERQRSSDGAIRSILTKSVRESELLLASEPDAVDLDRMQQSVADLSVAYLSNPAEPMLRQGMLLRQEFVRRLTSGAVRPQELLDIYDALSRISGILAYAAVDLGHPDAAAVHAHTTFRMADDAGDNELRAWARGTQALIARFDQHFDKSQEFIEDGLKYAGLGTSEVRLLCGAAQTAANLGDIDGALTYIDSAKGARDRAGVDTVEGLFGFSPAKQAYYSGSALMWLPDRKALTIAEESAGTAIAMWEHEPVEQRSLDDEALAHVYAATARLQLGEVDGALEAVRPVLDLPADRQISWIRKRVGNLADILTDDRFHGSVTAASARAELRAYSDGAGDLVEP